MKMIHSPKEMQTIVLEARSRGKRIGFVPTMGALHEGHMSLVQRARSECDICIMSIFVNPLQFGPNEDLDKYPRTLQNDCVLAERDGVDYVFAPSPREMYPDGFNTTVTCGGITEELEGAARPGHFDGVTTVVLKLFTITQPHFAVFGQKDAQQVLVVKRMVEDLNIPVEMIVSPTVRESDGLAMSSRNKYLTENERGEVALINRALTLAKDAFQSGERNARNLLDIVTEQLESAKFFTVEYVALTNEFCKPIEQTILSEALLSLACRTSESGTRLIDNVTL